MICHYSRSPTFCKLEGPVLECMDLAPEEKSFGGQDPRMGDPGFGDPRGIQASNLDCKSKHFSLAGQSGS